MGLSVTNALISVQDGGAAAANQANGATAQVSPGNTITFALQSTTGVLRWELVFSSDNAQINGKSFTWFPGMTNAFSLPWPYAPSKTTYYSTVSDGVASTGAAAGVILGLQGAAAGSGGQSHTARLVAASALAAYTNTAGVLTANSNGALANIDGVAPAVGDRILLAAGAAGADNGIYVVTSLGGASAKYTMQLAPDWAQGFVMPAGQTVEISEGTTFGFSTWKDLTAGAKTVGTTSVTFYPRTQKGSQALTSGTPSTATVSNIWVAPSGATCALTENTNQANNTLKGVLTAGAGSGSIAITGAATNTDTIFWEVFNW